MSSPVQLPPQASLPEAPSRPRAAGDTPEARRRAAQAFEGQVLGALLQPMFQGLATRGPFTGGAGEEQWRPLLVREMGDAISRAGGLGIALAVQREMERMR
ncbi:MAG: rod-binding protein [Acetobacteraceae bacterium]|nr:rod-binding protein [Acetobacteraceae bacterium]